MTKSPPYSLSAFLDTLLDANPSPVVVADLEGRLLVFNHAAELLLGYPAEDALDNLLAQDLFANAHHVPQLLNSLREKGRLSAQEVRVRAQDGESIPARMWARWLFEKPRESSLEGREEPPVAWLLVLEDCRESVDLETRLSRATHRLIASEKRTTTMEVAGAAAHNLNQPLTSIMGSVELLASRRDLPPEVRRRVNQIYDQLERMARAVHELAQVQKYQSTQYVGDTRILDLESE